MSKHPPPARCSETVNPFTASISNPQPANQESAIMRVSIYYFFWFVNLLSVKLIWNRLQSIYMMTSHHWFWKWLVVFRQQVTWGRVDQDLSHHVASPWSNELTQWDLGTPYGTWFCLGHHWWYQIKQHGLSGNTHMAFCLPAKRNVKECT